MAAVPDEVLREEVLEAPRRYFVPLPETRVIQRPGWFQLVTPTFRQGGFNEVSCSNLDEASADAIIDATLAEYRELGLKFRWEVLPGCKPDDLGERLERRGLLKSYVRGMYRVITEADDFEHASEGVTVEPVTDLEGLDVFTRTMATGWDVEEAPADRANRALFARPDRTHHFFVARHGGHAAGCAAYVAMPRSAYLLGAVVLPPFRGRGLYRALVDARLRDARSRGIFLGTSQAREATSAPILEGMAFRTAFRFATYSN